MIVLDANILLYAYDAGSRLHGRAKEWVEEILSGDKLVGLPGQTISAFVRITTNPRLPGARDTIEETAGVVDEWLEQPNVRAIGPSERHWAELRRMLTSGQARGLLTPDAELAALTLQHEGVLHTTDRGFPRFPGLRWLNPLN